jgi:hypothetical protein
LVDEEIEEEGEIFSAEEDRVRSFSLSLAEVITEGSGGESPGEFLEPEPALPALARLNSRLFGDLCDGEP